MRRTSARIAQRARVKAEDAPLDASPSIEASEKKAARSPMKREKAIATASRSASRSAKENVPSVRIRKAVKKEAVEAVKVEDPGTASTQGRFSLVKQEEPEAHLSNSLPRVTKRARIPDAKPDVQPVLKEEESMDIDAPGADDGSEFDGRSNTDSDESDEGQQPSRKRQKALATQPQPKKVAVSKKGKEPKKPKQKKLSAAERTAQELGLPPKPPVTDENSWRASEVPLNHTICATDAKKLYHVNPQKELAHLKYETEESPNRPANSLWKPMHLFSEREVEWAAWKKFGGPDGFKWHVDLLQAKHKKKYPHGEKPFERRRWVPKFKATKSYAMDWNDIYGVYDDEDEAGPSYRGDDNDY
ncbi:hypothetical protein DENSPDRAFT_840226 [Dentipellis sp. KUC8613]|nr:hypothetical protein DENSPDRAFT_840226 [Dentipellis sp. KUC8613]